MIRIVLFLTCSLSLFAKLQVLHLTFHKGCEKEICALAKNLDFDLTTMVMHSLPVEKFDGRTTNSDRYNIDSFKAKEIWNRNKETFLKYDLIITSDTAPLSRIFLENGWTKPLIVWVCNRFDYADRGTLKGDYPDAAYYDLIRKTKYMKNVRVVSYTEFEHVYAKEYRQVDAWNALIKPVGFVENWELKTSSIPKSIVKKDTFFVPNYHNDTILLDLSQKLNQLGIPNFRGRYNGPKDLKGFKGIIHIPYAWSNLALFENWSQGIIYFIPTPKFLSKLAKKGNFFWSPPFHFKWLSTSEWYNPSHRKNFIYFNSWEDLQRKIISTNYESKSKTVINFHAKHKTITLNQWKTLIETLTNL